MGTNRLQISLRGYNLLTRKTEQRFSPRLTLICQHKGLQVTDPPDEAYFNVQRFVDGLTGKERMLVVLKHELYRGSWQAMVDDLQARLAGGPYVFKLANRIEDDLERIERLSGFETRAGVDLSDFITLENVNPDKPKDEHE